MPPPPIPPIIAAAATHHPADSRPFRPCSRRPYRCRPSRPCSRRAFRRPSRAAAAHHRAAAATVIWSAAVMPPPPFFMPGASAAIPSARRWRRPARRACSDRPSRRRRAAASCRRARFKQRAVGKSVCSASERRRARRSRPRCRDRRRQPVAVDDACARHCSPPWRPPIRSAAPRCTPPTIPTLAPSDFRERWLPRALRASTTSALLATHQSPHERAAAMTLAHERSANRFFMCAPSRRIVQQARPIRVVDDASFAGAVHACAPRARTARRRWPLPTSNVGRNRARSAARAPLCRVRDGAGGRSVARAGAPRKNGRRRARRRQGADIRRWRGRWSPTRARCAASRGLLARAFRTTATSGCSPSSRSRISQELDFEREARNAARTAPSASEPQVHVPFVVGALSTRRVLTMEYIDGARLDDAPALATLGLPPAEVARLALDRVHLSS